MKVKFDYRAKIYIRPAEGKKSNSTTGLTEKKDIPAADNLSTAVKNLDDNHVGKAAAFCRSEVEVGDYFFPSAPPGFTHC